MSKGLHASGGSSASAGRGLHASGGGSASAGRGHHGSSGGSSSHHSHSDSSHKDPRDEISHKISSLTSEASRLQSEGMLSDVSREFTAIESEMDEAEDKFRMLRGKGFLYGFAIEEKMKRARERWYDSKREAQDELSRISSEVRYKSDNLNREVRELRDVFERDYREADRRYRDVDSRVDEFKRFIGNAKERIVSRYKNIRDEVREVVTYVREIENSFNLLDKASFKLHQGEDLIYVCGAQHLEDKKKNGPKGYIFLTSNRFIFEQDEDVVVSRTLIFFTKKEHVKKIIVDKPIGALDEIKDTKAGLLFKAELLELKLKDPSPPNEMMLKLNKDSTMLKNLIQSIISGSIERDKVGSGTSGTYYEEMAGVSAPPPAVIPAATEAQATGGPPKEIRCTGCGAAYNEPILKGMTSVNCPYCDTTIRF